MTSYSSAQQAPATAQPVQAAPATPNETLLKSGLPLSDEELRSRYVGKVIFLRGSYLGDSLTFDKSGKISGSAAVGSFTLSALQISKITLGKKSLEIEADRYGLHYRGALPFEDDGKAYDLVKISNKPVHIAIERELVVVPKAKKDKKKKKDQPAPVEAAANPRSGPR